MNFHPSLIAPCDLCLVACSAAKARTPQRPADLYQGRLYQLARRWAEAQATDWLILSAKHGLLDPHGDAIEPYEMALTQQTAKQRRAWGRCVAEQLTTVQEYTLCNGRRGSAGPILSSMTRVVALAPRPYVEPLQAALDKLDYFGQGARIATPLAGLGIGQQKRALIQALDGIAPRPRPARQLDLWAGREAA